MSDTIPLIIACRDYDHVRPLKDGTVKIANCNAQFVALNSGEMATRSFDDPQFNVAELSLATYITRRINGNCDYVAIPVYLARSFVHGNFYVRRDRGIRTPQDLRGRRVGIGGYGHTVYAWMRGLLQDEYGVTPAEIKWVSVSHRAADEPFQTPAGISIEWLDTQKTLPELLESGDIDVLAATRAPTSANYARLFADHEAVEDNYYRRIGIFPILHVVGIRTALVQRYPSLPRTIYQAFLDAKNLALSGSAAISRAARMRALLGDDYLPYGLNERDRNTLELFLKYHFQQGLAPRRFEFDELFAPVPLAQYEA